MFLKLDGYHLPDRSLTNISFIEGTPTVMFGGMAREDEGRGIALKLKDLASKTSISYEAVDDVGVHSSGRCRIVNLKVETVSTIPRIIVFSGELVLPLLRVQS